MEEQLKPCPFCGSPAEYRESGGWHGVGCDSVGTGCPAMRHALTSRTQAEAIAAWNTRTVPSPAPAGVTAKLTDAPKDGTPFLAWYPKLQLDEDDDPTDEVIGGAWAIVSRNGEQWDEPEWLGAHGAYFFEDWCFAEMPSVWTLLPPPPAATQRAETNTTRSNKT